jgi:hypothetical protein
MESWVQFSPVQPFLRDWIQGVSMTCLTAGRHCAGGKAAA